MAVSDEDLMALGEVLANFIGSGEYATIDQKDGGEGFLVLDGSLTVSRTYVEALVAAGIEEL